MSRIVIALLLAAFFADAQSFGVVGKSSYTPAPDHVYVDTAQLFDGTSNSVSVSTSQLENFKKGGAGSHWDMDHTNSLNWYGVTNLDLLFPSPIRVGGEIIKSSGLQWIQYKVTNGAPEKMSFYAPGTFGGGIYTNLTARAFFVFDLTNTLGDIEFFDLIICDGGRESVSQIQVNNSSTATVVSHAPNGTNSFTTLSISTKHPYYITHRRSARTFQVITQVHDGLTGSLLATLVGGWDESQPMGSSWWVWFYANYLNQGAASGTVTLGGISIAYTYE